MLTELRISNFALFDHLHLEFPSGFLVLTGETGGGKSLLLDALVLLSGGRASPEHIRSHAEEAIVEAAFSIANNTSLVSYLRERDLLGPDQQELIIRRILSRTGKNKIYVNGSIAPLQVVQKLARWLIDIHSQHDQQSLLSSQAQLEVLDGFGDTKNLRERLGNAFRVWQEKKSELANALDSQATQQGRQEVRDFQLEELRQANLQIGEEESLEQEYQRLKYSGQIEELTDRIYHMLYEGEGAVLGSLQSTAQWVKELADIDPGIEPLIPLGEAASVSIQELIEELRKYRQQFDYDPNRFAEIDDRLASIQRLKRKYRATVEQLIDQKQILEQENEGFANIHEHIERLTQQVVVERTAVEKLGQELSERRNKVVKLFEKK